MSWNEVAEEMEFFNRTKIYHCYAELLDDKIDRTARSDADRHNIDNLINQVSKQETYLDKLLCKLSEKDFALFYKYTLDSIHIGDTDYKCSDDISTYKLNREWKALRTLYNTNKEIDLRLLKMTDLFFTDTNNLPPFYNSSDAPTNYLINVIVAFNRGTLHPIRKQYKLRYSDKYINPLKNQCYIPILLTYEQFNNVPSKKEILYEYIDIILVLLESCFMEFHKIISIFFDLNLGFFSHNPKSYKKIKDKFISITNKYRQLAEEKMYDTDSNLSLKTVMVYLSFENHYSNIHYYYHQIIEKLMDKKITKPTDSCDLYHLSPYNIQEYPSNIQELKNKIPNIRKKDYYEYLYEKKNVKIDSYSKHKELLDSFLKETKLHQKRNFSIPSIGIELSTDNLLDLKLLIYALIKNDTDCNLNIDSDDDFSNIGTQTIMTRAIDYANTIRNKVNDDLKNNDDIAEKTIDIEIEYDSNNYSIINNQKNNLLNKNTLLLTEKIRYAFYREFEQLPEYLNISKIQLEYMDFFNLVAKIPNPVLQISIFSNYYLDIYNEIFYRISTVLELFKK